MDIDLEIQRYRYRNNYWGMFRVFILQSRSLSLLIGTFHLKVFFGYFWWTAVHITTVQFLNQWPHLFFDVKIIKTQHDGQNHQQPQKSWTKNTKTLFTFPKNFHFGFSPTNQPTNQRTSEASPCRCCPTPWISSGASMGLRPRPSARRAAAPSIEGCLNV